MGSSSNSARKNGTGARHATRAASIRGVSQAGSQRAHHELGSSNSEQRERAACHQYACGAPRSEVREGHGRPRERLRYLASYPRMRIASLHLAPAVPAAASPTTPMLGAPPREPPSPPAPAAPAAPGATETEPASPAAAEVSPAAPASPPEGWLIGSSGCRCPNHCCKLRTSAQHSRPNQDLRYFSLSSSPRIQQKEAPPFNPQNEFRQSHVSDLTVSAARFCAIRTAFCALFWHP